MASWLNYRGLCLIFAAPPQSYRLRPARGDHDAHLLQYPVALFGALQTGMVVVNVNPLYTPRELEHQLNDSGTTTIIVLENFANTLECSVLPKTQVQNIVVASMRRFASAASKAGSPI